MRLKKIRLAGFKSFVDPTNIPFPGDMTAIVGPNGCGKSNVIDAVRWVLGESSAKNLRGDAMTDVIFNGSSARKPVSQCSVELVFDNSTGRIAGEYAAYNELSVKRVVTKDAVSSYLLNGAKCRRKDITDLFLGTGLGPRSYAIIEQGMISRLIESKPQELRVFIEEAAGISKYKERRRETQNRINHTKDNLDRLQDVRLALGEQLAKLKRQATAATRYKELKKEERNLKAQVATLRWLAQTELVKKSDKIIHQLRDEINTLMANKQGDESGMQALKNELSVSKQTASDRQAQIYTIGNEITKVEQSQIFAKKRLGQIQYEKEQLYLSQQTLNTQANNLQQELLELKEQLDYIEPEKFVLEEKADELNFQKSEMEKTLQALELRFRNEDEAYFQAKQKLQALHGQLQQTLSLQQRTQERITELNAELEDNAQFDLRQLEAYRNNKEVSEAAYQEAQAALEQAKHKERESQGNLNEFQAQHLALKNRLVTEQATLEALSALQAQASKQQVYPSFIDQQKLQPIWQAFSTSDKYLKCLETLLQVFDRTFVYDGELSSHQACIDTNVSLWFTHTFTSDKRPNTLAEVIEQERVPCLFNAIYIAKPEQNLLDIVNSQDLLCVLSLEGKIVLPGVLLTHNSQQESKLERAAKMREIQAKIYEIEVKITDCADALEAQENACKRAENEKQSAQVNFDNAYQLAMKAKNEYDLAEMRYAQTHERQLKLETEREKQTHILQSEEESLALLNIQIEDLSIEVADKEDFRASRTDEKTSLSRTLNEMQAQLTTLQSQMHQQQLQIQQLRNSVQLASEQFNTKQQLISDSQDKLNLLEQEIEQLMMPSEDQAEHLQSMLKRKEDLAREQAELEKHIANLEEELKTLEQGQSGINNKIDALKSEMESERLQGESARVRAQGFIDQLAEMRVPVRDVLESLPEAADEHSFQTELEKTSMAIQRLGAVNLAAVDEYEEQAQRKAHLDAQDQDLSAALATLEDAMRKIDKETRTRFKSTFDRVNDDLKKLFPKVFGGGSAYLDLTDDDLLDTGVTIMARPPGKKNSTIQLLSGGEKALTALSLVFAIFRLNPAPFCLLDEVDAPLDDANVGRFCNLVSEMSKSVQFIYITHNKVAMEMASDLTGVTMSEPGVSRMVSVNMEEALAIAE